MRTRRRTFLDNTSLGREPMVTAIIGLRARPRRNDEIGPRPASGSRFHAAVSSGGPRPGLAFCRSAAFTALVIGMTVTPSIAQTTTVRTIRAQPAVAAPAAPPPADPVAAAPAHTGTPGTAAAAGSSDFSTKEIESLKATYDSLTAEEKAEMVAYYEGMGVDLLVVLGLKTPELAVALPLPDSVRMLNFARKPAAVLKARSELGFGTSRDMPDAKDTAAVAKWLHTNVLAGEWDALGKVFAAIEPNEATDIYSHVLRSTNEGGGGLLPEEVLALGDACPGDMADWQLDVLAQLLKGAAERYGTGPFMARVKEGTVRFGDKNTAMRERTVRLLIGAGMALEGFEFLPPLEDARVAGEARVVFAHGRYHEDLGASGRLGPEGEEHLRQAWALLGEVAMMEKAETSLRTEAMRRAIDLLPNIAPAQASEWLGGVFANPALGPAALEVVTLQAMTIRNKAVDAAKRAQSIATMKAAVDTLLARPDVDLAALRVPLRMLTTALADEVDAAVAEKGGIRGVAPETVLLFRASPGEKWLNVLEPSVSIRGHRAVVAIATIADETDEALDRLTRALARHPDLGIEFADEFLRLWEKRLNPQEPQNENYYFYFYGPQRLPAAPLTRGRQHRNLDRLERLLTIVEGMGVKARQLPSVASAFKACHARTEVYDRAAISRIFGSEAEMPGRTAAALAESMRAGLGGDWRSRTAQRQYGMMRSQAEIADMVEVGYELAIGLADRALTQEPESWRHAVLKAALSYDRVRFKQTQAKDNFAEYNEYRKQAFAAFEEASNHYAALVAGGQEHDSSNVYLQWFSAVLDAGQPIPKDQKQAAEDEEATNADQIERIAAAMKRLPPDAYERHVGAFAQDLISALSGAPPERKPTIVRAGVKIVGDHPAGAALHRLSELYQDLVSNEIRLRLTVDGSDAVGHGKLFGLVLTLRYTNSVDRETGGFDKYLYQETYVRIGNQYRTVNYQAQIRKGIETALSDQFTIESLGFFEPLTPSREVREDGQTGWQEKPLAYILLKANDPSVDKIPRVTFDMHFDDQLGPVTLPILSNTPPIDAAGAPGRRPVRNMQVSQTVDVRRLVEGDEGREVLVEVQAKGEGVIPEIADLLEGLESALPGYALAKDGVEARPYTVIQTDDGRERYYFWDTVEDEDKAYATADSEGIFRLTTERSWMVTLKPSSGAVGKALTLPKLKEGVAGTLVSRHYADMDIVEVKGATLAVDPRWSIAAKITLAVGGVVVVGGALWLFTRRRKPAAAADAGYLLPTRITPLSTIAALQRIGEAKPLDEATRRSLTEDIAAIERTCFGPQNGEARPDEAAMGALLKRWAATAQV